MHFLPYSKWSYQRLAKCSNETLFRVWRSYPNSAPGEDAFHLLHERAHPYLMGLVNRHSIGLNHSEITECVAAVWQRVVELFNRGQVPVFRGDGHFFCWLVPVTQYVILNFSRQRKNRNRGRVPLLDDEDAALAGRQDVLGEVICRDLVAVLQQKLKPKLWRNCELLMAGFSSKEAAAELKLSTRQELRNRREIRKVLKKLCQVL